MIVSVRKETKLENVLSDYRVLIWVHVEYVRWVRK